MTRNQFVCALSILTLCLFQPVLAQTVPEENKIVSEVPLRNFEGAWSEAQVREWVDGPVKEWLDKADLFFSMIKPDNWALVEFGEVGERYVEAVRYRFQARQQSLLAAQTNQASLLFQPYNLIATIGVGWSISNVGEELSSLGNLRDQSGFTGGPSIELAIALINHSTEGDKLLTEVTPHFDALLRWHDEAVEAPRW